MRGGVYRGGRRVNVFTYGTAALTSTTVHYDSRAPNGFPKWLQGQFVKRSQSIPVVWVKTREAYLRNKACVRRGGAVRRWATTTDRRSSPCRPVAAQRGRLGKYTLPPYPNDLRLATEWGRILSSAFEPPLNAQLPASQYRAQEMRLFIGEGTARAHKTCLQSFTSKGSGSGNSATPATSLTSLENPNKGSRPIDSERTPQPLLYTVSCCLSGLFPRRENARQKRRQSVTEH